MSSMKRARKQHRPGFKAKVALESVRGERTLNELAGQFELHPTQVVQWKKRLVEGATGLFSGHAGRDAAQESVLRDRIDQEIGQLKVELDWLKKKRELLA
jgi:putative transposase